MQESTLLKTIDAHLDGDDIGNQKYVTPERGGVLVYEPGVENSILNDPNWLGTRRVNQQTQFKQQSVAQFRRLEHAVLREAEGKVVADFRPYVERINGLLDQHRTSPGGGDI